jgi:hypothetical protein
MKSSKEAQDYGEPWEVQPDMVRGKDGEEIWYTQLLDRNGELVSLGHSKEGDTNYFRVAECISALKGCPDPQAFVDTVKIMLFNIELLDNGRYKNGEKIRLDMISSFVGFICADAKEHLSWPKDKQ